MADFIRSQAASFLAFFACGIGAAVFFDFLRILRKLRKHHILAVTLEDSIFWTTIGITLFRLLYLFQSGNLRFFLIPAFGLGFFLWNRTLSRFF